MWRLIFVLLLTGCSGTMQGLSTSGDAVKVEWTNNMNGSGTMTVHLSGETFTGKHVRSSSTGTGLGFSSGNTAFGAGSSESSNAQAILFGDKGSSMQCRFVYSDPLMGVAGGGIGNCQVSTGDFVNLQF